MKPVDGIPKDEDPQNRIKLLRDQVARLISRNLELERQLEDLKRAKADTGIESLAGTVVRSVQSAQQAMADETPGGLRYVVSELETTFRGILLQVEDRLVLRLPLPENGVRPGHLSTLRMSLAQVPQSVLPEAASKLSTALERAQLLFSGWTRRAGAKIAGELQVLLTCLLATPKPWEGEGFVRNMQGLAATIDRLSITLTRKKPPRVRQGVRGPTGAFLEMTKRLRQEQALQAEDAENLAASLEGLVRRLSAMASVGV